MVPLWWRSQTDRLWLLAAPLTVNLLRPLERETWGGGGGGGPDVMGLSFGTEEASSAGVDSSSEEADQEL